MAVESTVDLGCPERAPNVTNLMIDTSVIPFIAAPRSQYHRIIGKGIDFDFVFCY